MVVLSQAQHQVETEEGELCVLDCLRWEEHLLLLLLLLVEHRTALIDRPRMQIVFDLPGEQDQGPSEC